MTQRKNASDASPSAESEKKANVNGKRRRLVLFIGAGFLILMLAFGFPFALHTLSYESTDDAFIEGTIVAVRPLVSGYVAKVMADDNQWVHAGDPLLKLEPADYKAACNAATAALEAARASAAAAGAVVKTAVAEAAASESLEDQTFMSIVRSHVWVTSNFKETQSTHMRPGQPVRLTVDAFPDVSFTGRVDSIQHGTGARFSLLPAENATGNYIKVVQRVPVKIVFDPEDQLGRYPLEPGLSVCRWWMSPPRARTLLRPERPP